MKKLALFLLLAVMVLVLAACGTEPADTTTAAATTTADPTINQPAAEGTPLTVVSCQQVAFVNGERTYRLTFSNGSTANFSVKDGKDASAPTVKSCVAVSTDENNVTTWRITFSDNSTADFTVSNATPIDSTVNWEELLASIEEMTDLLTVTSPDMETGHSTVSDTSQTSWGVHAAPGNAASDFVSGLGFPMTKDVMFGDDEKVYAMRLNKYKMFDRSGAHITEGEFVIEIQIRSYSSTKRADQTTLVTTYTTSATLAPGKEYIDLLVEIPRSDFAQFEDDEYFFMLINVLCEGDYALRCSNNPTFHFVPTERLVKPDGTDGAYLYVGYVVNGTSRRNPANSYKPNTPDIFFSTAMKKTAIDLSDLVGSNSGTGTGTVFVTDHLLQLPDTFDLVVGDTFELFYKGITLCIDSDVFDYELRFSDGKSRGNNYARKYIWTPTAADVGVHTLTITVRDNYGSALDSGTVKLNVVNKPVTPNDEKVFLFIGASNTANGTWPAEVIRRLTGTGTTTASGAVGPKGDGLINIKTIGTIKATDAIGDVYYEGYGGWSFPSYTTANTSRPYFVYVNGAFSMLELTQHSFYKDSNNQVWKLEYISDTRLKLIAVKSVGGNVDTSCKGITGNTLTWVGGAQGDEETITFTSTTAAEGNPFWNVETGKNDFKAYAEKHGVETIDEVLINLGWNSTNGDAAALVSEARVLIEGILADFPDCHITLIGLNPPSRDGFGTNYGVSWNYYEKLAVMFSFQEAFVKLAREEYNGSVSFAPVAGVFDAENCYPTVNMPINNRIPTTEAVQNNGLHPTKAGYYLMADAVYRHIAARYQGD